MASFGHPGGKCAQTADRGSSIAAFGPWKKVVIKLLIVAVGGVVIHEIKANLAQFLWKFFKTGPMQKQEQTNKSSFFMQTFGWIYNIEYQLKCLKQLVD